MKPYYSDDYVTIYHGDCLELADLWTCADVLVTDPPYGIAWRGTEYNTGTVRPSIANDNDTAARDDVLLRWGALRPSVVFGSPLVAPPAGTKQVLVWVKPPDAGFLGTVAGYRRDWEAVYILGSWPTEPAGRSAIIRAGGSTMNSYLTGHPHAKPVDLLRDLIKRAPDGVIVDPFMGSGTTLRAAKDLGRKAIGIELEERYCELAARRCAQEVMFT